MFEVSGGFLHRSNPKEFSIRAVAKAFELGKNKPDPMTAFAALFQFFNYSGNNLLLRINKTLKIIGIGRTYWHDREG